MSDFVFLHENLAYRGGGEIMLGHVARLAGSIGKTDLGLLWGEHLDGLTIEEREVFAEIRAFQFPNSLGLRGIYPHVHAFHALKAWLGQRSPRKVVSFTLRPAVRAARLANALRFQHIWMCQQSFPLFDQPLQSIKEFIGLRNFRISETEIVCIAQEAVSRFVQLGLPPERLHLIRNGIDVGQFQNPTREPLPISETEKAKLDGADLVAVCVARLDPIKRHEVFLRAVAIARDKGTDVAALVVGDPGPLDLAYASNLRQMASDLEIADRVVWAGHQNDVRPWLAAADVAVLSSRKEAGGLALAEAGAAGLPLVGSHVGGIPELVQDGVTGFTFQPENSHQLAELFMLLAGNKGLRQTLGQNARQVVCDEFDGRKQDEKWLAILNKKSAVALEQGKY